MKRQALLLTGTIGLAAHAAFAGGSPRGNLLELHSCEVFAGPCVVSSEAQQSARYMLRVWDFSGGSFAGQEMAGLRLAVLQVSPDNLAASDSRPGDAVIYLPESATSGQLDTLLAWLKSAQPELRLAKTSTRVAPLQLTKTEGGYSFRAGDSMRVETGPLGSCENRSCGEALWYQPRSATTLFTVALNRSSAIHEPLLQLNWEDGGKRSVFLARFGQPETTRGLFVTLNEVCGDVATVF